MLPRNLVYNLAKMDKRHLTHTKERQAAPLAPWEAPPPVKLTEQQFARLGRFIYDEVGIKMPPTKKTMVEARLQKRVRLLNYPDLEAYLAYTFSPAGLQDELFHLIDAITTNTTSFFREPQHFEYLSSDLLPAWVARQSFSRTFKVWSAGCSLGMEPYTLAMVLSEFAERNAGFTFSILATDISTRALKTASQGIYDREQIKGISDELLTKYFMRSKDPARNQVRVVPELRRQIQFKRLNFMDEFTLRPTHDVIFCRNVVIYFDRPTQQRHFSKLLGCLLPDGYLFIGHSETLSGLTLPVKQIIPTVYKKA